MFFPVHSRVLYLPAMGITTLPAERQQKLLQMAKREEIIKFIINGLKPYKKVFHTLY